MKVKICIPFIVLILIGCSPKLIVGTYVNECKLYGNPKSILTLKDDKTFINVFPYMIGLQIEGNWKVVADTLILDSKFITSKNFRDSITTSDEFTHLPNYILLRNKIKELPLNADTNSCNLKKQ